MAVGGYQPLGYKDEAKTAATFIEFEGRRYSCPGDYAMVETDGSLTLLGRGSVVINTGGEKVFPEEVEEVLKTHPGVETVAVGVPDEKFGEAVAAVIEPSGDEPAEDELIAHVRTKLAAYKAPKHVFTVSIGPGPQVDYKRMKAIVGLPRHLKTTARPGGGDQRERRVSCGRVRPAPGVAPPVPPAARRDRRQGHQALRAGDRGGGGRYRRAAVGRRRRGPGAGRSGRRHRRARGGPRAGGEHELLTQTPMAGDMRYLVSVLRVVPELERSGDLAERIAQRAATGLALP